MGTKTLTDFRDNGVWRDENGHMWVPIETVSEAVRHALGVAKTLPVENPQYEYATTTGPRKGWDNMDEPPEGEGWELDPDLGRPGESWDRFDYHEERYWRRPL